MNKYNKVEVIWFDAQTHSGYAEDIGELKNWKPVESHSFGYLLHEDKEKIILGFLLFIGEEMPDQVKHCQMIPKGMIKKVRVIEKFYEGDKQ